MASSPTVSFGPVHVVEPTAPHTHTAVLLHGRGSTGEEFAEELLEASLSNGQTLAQNLSSWRWVFPSSGEAWSAVFEEHMPAWFEARSLTDVTDRQDLQEPGIRSSVGHVSAVLDGEIERLAGRAEKLVLGGISQGAAVGLWTLLCRAKVSSGLGAFIGASTWLPFATQILSYHDQANTARNDIPDAEPRQSDSAAFVADMLPQFQAHTNESQSTSAMPLTTVFLGHGTDDAFMDVEHGRQARDVLSRLGFQVEWREYEGAEQEGHWLKEPEELDDILSFTKTQIQS
ncbi:Acyl-protein thioesterase 1 [Paramyrothecium foliicola]|nr:Acyl-protein thioesterase 1 [Paramyrothecium foliicola]